MQTSVNALIGWLVSAQPAVCPSQFARSAPQKSISSLPTKQLSGRWVPVWSGADKWFVPNVVGEGGERRPLAEEEEEEECV